MTNEEDQKSLLLFDDDDETMIFKVTDYLVSYMTGMPYSDNGWLTKKIFLANRSDRNVATFSYAYMGAMTTRVGLALLASTTLILTF